MSATFRDFLTIGPPHQDYQQFDRPSHTSAEGVVQSAIGGVYKELIQFNPPPSSKPIKVGGERRHVMQYHSGDFNTRILRVAVDDSFDSTLDSTPFHMLLRTWMSEADDRKGKTLSSRAGLRKPDGVIAVWTTVPFPTASDVPSLVPTPQPEPSSDAHSFSRPPDASSTPPSTSPATRASAAEQISRGSSGKAAAKRPSSRSAGGSSAPGGSAVGNSAAGRSAGGNSAAGSSAGGNSAASSSFTTLDRRVGAGANEAAYCSASLVAEVKPVTKPLSELYAQLLCYLVSIFEVCNGRLGLVVKGVRWGRVAVAQDALLLVEVKDGGEGVKLLGGVNEFFAGLGAPSGRYCRLPRDLSVRQEGERGQIWRLANPDDYSALCATFEAAVECLADYRVGERIWRLPDPPLAAPDTAWGAVRAAIHSSSIGFDLSSRKDRLAVIAKRRSGGDPLLESQGQPSSAPGGNGWNQASTRGQGERDGTDEDRGGGTGEAERAEDNDGVDRDDDPQASKKRRKKSARASPDDPPTTLQGPMGPPPAPPPGGSGGGDMLTAASGSGQHGGKGKSAVDTKTPISGTGGGGRRTRRQASGVSSSEEVKVHTSNSSAEVWPRTPEDNTWPPGAHDLASMINAGSAAASTTTSSPRSVIEHWRHDTSRSVREKTSANGPTSNVDIPAAIVSCPVDLLEEESEPEDWPKRVSEAGSEQWSSDMEVDEKEDEEEENEGVDLMVVEAVQAIMRQKGFLFYGASAEVFDRLVEEMRGASATSA
ncbi:hypothetical protein IAT38_001954 [Cryptococcus sp. DSM 104549]